MSGQGSSRDRHLPPVLAPGAAVVSRWCLTPGERVGPRGPHQGDYPDSTSPASGGRKMGMSPDRSRAAITAIQSGEALEVCMGCQLLMQLGATAGDVRPLVWDYLRHPDGMVRGNAGGVLLECCPDTRIWADAAAVLEAEPTGDNLAGAFIRYAVHRLRKAVEAEVAPNPSVTFSPEWRTSTAVALAQRMYDSREFSAMPILADALQDAGCDSADVLEHCRGPGPHVRGCWVVDLVLGKE